MTVADHQICGGEQSKFSTGRSVSFSPGTAAHTHVDSHIPRLTNAFSKKFETQSCYCAHFAYYNFVKTHKTLRVTPAMEAGITDHVWTITNLIA